MMGKPRRKGGADDIDGWAEQAKPETAQTTQTSIKKPT
jgi:hypothetical protein